MIKENINRCISEIDVALHYLNNNSCITNYNWNETLKKRTVVAFGTGKFMEDTHSRLFRTLDIEYLCDNNDELWGKQKWGRKIIPPSKLNTINDVFVVIVVGDPRDIMKQLRALNIEYMHISEMHFSGYLKGRPTTWLEDSYEQIRDVLHLLDDDRSREIFTRIFCRKIYLSKTNDEYMNFFEEGEYFENGLWVLDSNESFIDGGAYIGDTIDDFIIKTQGNFSDIFSFEYEKKNYMTLSKHIEESYPKYFEKIHLYNLGIWNKNEKGYCSHFGESDGTEIVKQNTLNTNVEECNLISLDSLLSEKRITAIKFDIEGSEKKRIVWCKKNH